ncbi:hypothetical protein FOZ62_014750, partial [Perkinsus olseni]
MCPTIPCERSLKLSRSHSVRTECACPIHGRKANADRPIEWSSVRQLSLSSLMYHLDSSPFSSVSTAPSTPTEMLSSPQLGSPLKSHPLHRYRSRFCVYNVTGGQGCLDGDRCPFAHSPYQLARPKSYLCPSKAGYCRGRGACPFAHDEDELEKSPLPVIKRLCKY